MVRVYDPVISLLHGFMASYSSYHCIANRQKTSVICILMAEHIASAKV